MSTSLGQIRALGDGLAFRLTKSTAKIAGVTDDARVRVIVKPGHIIIETETETETETEPTLEQMLATFDPKKHARRIGEMGHP